MTNSHDMHAGSPRPRQPVDLILMAGYPGVGKSTIAVELATALRYPLFDIDDILTEVETISGVDDWRRRGRLAYNILKRLVAKQTQRGVPAIVDTPLSHQWLRDFMFSLKVTSNATVHVIYCSCSDAVAIQRNHDRLAAAPNRYAGRDAENFDRIKGLFQPIAPIASITVDTEQPVAESVLKILSYLSTSQKDRMDNNSMQATPNGAPDG
jgi:predicted kinase